MEIDFFGIKIGKKGKTPTETIKVYKFKNKELLEMLDIPEKPIFINYDFKLKQLIIKTKGEM